MPIMEYILFKLFSSPRVRVDSGRVAVAPRRRGPDTAPGGARDGTTRDDRGPHERRPGIRSASTGGDTAAGNTAGGPGTEGF